MVTVKTSLIWILICNIQLVRCFSITSLLKGSQVHRYMQGQRVHLLVNKIESDETQLPYSYYDLPFVCPPMDDAKPVTMSLGEVFNGDRLWDSNYGLYFGIDESCKRLCDRITQPEALRRADQLIRQGYVVQWTVDSLPGATTFISSSSNSKYYASGFPLGFVKDGDTYLHNHVMIVIRWHTEAADPAKKVIVGFEVYPRSVSDYQCPGASSNFDNYKLDINSTEPAQIPFTYAVYWREEKDLSWENRWSMYFVSELNQGNIHWFSLVNSFVLVLFLSTVVGVVLYKTLTRDINEFKSSHRIHDAVTEELKFLPNVQHTDSDSDGWKSIRNEVFHVPSHPLLLSILGGSGFQILLTALSVIIFYTIGVLRPQFKGDFFTISFASFILAGFGSGFAGAQFYFQLKSDPHMTAGWRKVSILCGVFCTSVILSTILFCNFFVWAKSSSFALPIRTILILVLSIIVIEIPLSYMGGYVSKRLKYSWSLKGSSKSSLLRTKSSNDLIIKTPIPKQPFYNKLFVAVPLFGAFPFGIIYVELLFIFRSLWLEKSTYYYMYGFLFVTVGLLCIVIVETAIIATFLSVNKGNYNWHWRSFIIGGSVAFYLTSYSIFYLIFYLKVVDFTSTLIYLIYMALISCTVGVACGSVGLFSSIILMNTIYNAIKDD
ncbi:cellular adhesion and filamentous growth protein [Komagataella phaffii CBS 7435]|uniref:Transmembrane 9 superfamily member n=2 Tax=Komagataella phaffii TaxID=460519 RepID=C4QVC7_KOMPG|nr:Protein with a role in cellular adhesion and filamentous growth [Komagataella phaffii GS115]CAH2445855.1 cellular adhesion and filamentous growth protein [Komagataella phaffii CBS 7435]CAY67200.1 Protein with a role in cellular adhesion and filamentous growth [Komagataella phaffii GS115]CCA36309.2 cellular adhesion and filamentous growth protein [Komagataella phaffii CBS 7435]